LGKIDIQGTADHVTSVQNAMAQIKKTKVGAIILADIAATGKNLTIKAYSGNDDPVFGPCNALTSAVTPVDSAPDGVGSRGHPWYKGTHDQVTTRGDDERFEENPKGYSGTGKGSDIVMEISPDVIARANCYGGKSGSLPDEVFFHELVHALRKMQGKSNPHPTKNAAYSNEEEFLSIVTANVYISEKGSSDLRENYDGHSTLPPPLNTSSGFLANADNLHLMQIHHLVWLPTFLNLAKVITANFNPFRQLVYNLAFLNKKVQKPFGLP
jgi:hypothetical protein